MKKLLFVCSENRLRSPTAEAIFSEYEGIEAIGAGKFLEKKYDFNFRKDVTITIELDIVGLDTVHSNSLKFVYEPNLRKGLFRPID